MPAQIFSPDVRLTILATALGFMVLEYLLGRLASHDTHDLREVRPPSPSPLGRTW